MNFPSRHPLAGTGGTGYQADVTLFLEVSDVSAAARAAKARGGKTVNITAMTLTHKSNIQDFGHYPADLDLDIGADAEATLPALIEECKKLITADRRRAMDDRAAESRRRRISKGGRGRSIRRIWAGTQVR